MMRLWVSQCLGKKRMDDIAIFVLGMFVVLIIIALNVVWTSKINQEDIKKRLEELESRDTTED